jgi:YfiH family protein
MMVMQLPQPSRGFEWTQAPWGAALECEPLARIAPHLFTIGNLQLRDDHEEWQAVASRMGVERDRLLLINQVHGTDVAIVRRGESPPSTRPTADAIVTDDPDVAIAVRVADCAPILLADTRRPVVGAMHAGWRGTVASIVRHAVAVLEAEFGSRPEELVAAIGPCLGVCCGEVGDEVIEAFRNARHAERDIERWFTPGPRERRHIDLWQSNADQLRSAGLTTGNIHVAGLCTRTHADLMHSYRAKGTAAGRMVGVIRLDRTPRTL